MKSYGERLLECYKVYANDMDCSFEDVKTFLKEDWGQYGDRGYRLAVGPETEGVHIERIDEMEVFSGDLEAGEQAEKDGIKLIPMEEIINDYPYFYMRFIDTEENRETLKKEGALK